MSLKSSTCQDINPLLDAYHDGELNEIEREAVASHLVSCPSCQDKISGINSVVSSLKNLPRVQMSRDLGADTEFLKHLLAAPSSETSEPVAANNAKKAGAEIKTFPAKLQPSGKPPIKSLLPLPGPVIFASVAAAAALALLITVPRYLNNSAATNTSVASLPKQRSPKSTENLGSNPTALAQKGSTLEIKLGRNHIGTAGAGEEINHEVAQNYKQPDDANGHGESKDAQPSSDAGDAQIASAHMPAVSQTNMPATNSVADATDSRDSQFVSSAVSEGDQTTQEHDVLASATSSPEQGELLAIYPSDQNTITDELAIPTDEDGLYALKL